MTCNEVRDMMEAKQPFDCTVAEFNAVCVHMAECEDCLDWYGVQEFHPSEEGEDKKYREFVARCKADPEWVPCSSVR